VGGPGAISAVIAELVGPTGRLNASTGILKHSSWRAGGALARHAAEQAGLANLVFSEGAADATGLVPDSADVVMMRDVLAHNGGYEQAIVDHPVSLVHPGGAVYLADVASRQACAADGEPGDFRTAWKRPLTWHNSRVRRDFVATN
jgi:hypothetical protein